MKLLNINFILCVASLSIITVSTHAMQTIKMRNIIDPSLLHNKPDMANKNYPEEGKRFTVWTTNKEFGIPRKMRKVRSRTKQLPPAPVTFIPWGETIEYPINLEDDSAIVTIDYDPPFNAMPIHLPTQELKKILTDKDAVLDFFLEQYPGSSHYHVRLNIVSIPPAPPAPMPQQEQKEQKPGKASDAAGQTPQTGGN